jgi:lysozyme family protein
MFKNELRFIIFDTAINMGVVTAIKILQETCNIKIDGILGADTLRMSVNVAPAEYLLFRTIKYNDIIDNDPSQLVFRRGWIHRITRIMNLYKNGQLA